MKSPPFCKVGNFVHQKHSFVESEQKGFVEIAPEFSQAPYAEFVCLMNFRTSVVP